MSLSPAFLDELKSRTTLSALVGKKVKLAKAGREFKGCCPIHNEKSPSFFVNDDKGFYHCFGCSAHGDAFKWLEVQEGMEFMDAVHMLADAAGMDVPASPRFAGGGDEAERKAVRDAERARAAHLRDCVAGAVKAYADALGDASEAESYLTNTRRLSLETCLDFQLGFAPPERDFLPRVLGVSAEDLVDAGLWWRNDKGQMGPYFQARITIPVHDARGAALGFSARVLPGSSDNRKYVNTPERPFFDKGGLLFNEHRAREALRGDGGRLLLVEGAADVIALAHAGEHRAVAPLGTALTARQIARLWKLHPAPTVLLDGDAAGMKAALRAAELALAEMTPGQSLNFATLPDGLDPDALVSAGGLDALGPVLAGVKGLGVFLFERSV